MKKYFPLLLVTLLWVSSSVLATNYYVSNTGNDNQTGLSVANALLTLQHAATVVTAGDSVFVSDGAYKGFDIREVYGSSEKPIVFKAVGANVLIDEKGPRRDDGINIEDCSHIVVDGFTVKDMPGSGNGIRVVIADFCVIRNCWCDHNAERGIFTGFTDDILIEYNRCSNSIAEHGIYISNSSDRPIVRYNECWGNNAIGIHMNGDLSMGEDGINHDAQIYGNYLHDNNRAAGINLDGVLNPIIYNNVITNNHQAQGIALFQQDGAIVTHGAKIYNNTIVVPDDGRWGILLMDGAQVNTEIYNNIIITQHAWRGSITAENITGLKSDYNLLSNSLSNAGDGSTITFGQWQALGVDQHSIMVESYESIFLSLEKAHYELPVFSPAIDKGNGTLVSSVVKTDFSSLPRPTGSEYDIGAYEYIYPISSKFMLDRNLSVYPNPATDFIEIESGQPILSYQLFSISGEKVQSGNFIHNNHLSVQHLENGMYVLKTFSPDATGCVKFSVNKR
jgi:hypothetical protein